LDNRVELPVDLGARQAEQVRAQIDVLATGQLWMKARAELDQRDDVSADADGAARRPRDPRDQLEQRRLARAVSADDAETGADRHIQRDVAQRPDRRADLSARRRVHLVGLALQIADLRGDQIPERTRTAGAVLLGDLVELDGEIQITSAKYLSTFLNITNADTNRTAVIAAEIATTFQSGARLKMSDDRKPSTMAVSGLSMNSQRSRAEVCDSG